MQKIYNLIQDKDWTEWIQHTKYKHDVFFFFLQTSLDTVQNWNISFDYVISYGTQIREKIK